MNLGCRTVPGVGVCTFTCMGQRGAAPTIISADHGRKVGSPLGSDGGFVELVANTPYEINSFKAQSLDTVELTPEFNDQG